MFRRQDIFKKHAGGDGALSQQELEMLQAVDMGHKIDSALELWNNRFWFSWFDSVSDILNLLNAINTLVWHRNYIPCK